MAVQEKRYTSDEFHAFIERPENRKRLFELIDGIVVEKGKPYPRELWHDSREMREDAPPLVIMVRFPSDAKRKLRRDAEDYLRIGTKAVWLIFPEDQRVDVYMQNRDIIEVGIDGVLDGGDVLP